MENGRHPDIISLYCSVVLRQAVLCPISECYLMVHDTFLLSHRGVQCMLGAVCGEL